MEARQQDKRGATGIRYPVNPRRKSMTTRLHTIAVQDATGQTAAVRAAGYSDAQIVEAVSANLFTNMINRVNDTTLDFPAVD
jgi:hypothetical protein